MKEGQRLFEKKILVWILGGIIAAITIPSLGSPPSPPLVYLFGYWGGVLTVVIFIGGLFLSLWLWIAITNNKQNNN